MALIVIASSLKDIPSCTKQVTEPKQTLKLQGMTLQLGATLLTYGFKKASNSALVTVDRVQIASK